jgi:hypothetical protein
VNDTALGTVLAAVAGLFGSWVVYVGKRGETRNSFTDQLQEELATERAERKAAQAEVDVLRQRRRDDLVRMTQLEVEIVRLGGTPPP